jgi:hypothetical protein
MSSYAWFKLSTDLKEIKVFVSKETICLKTVPIEQNNKPLYFAKFGMQKTF